jgi:prepilin-type processing-associated H-X9-DG protein
MGVRHGSRNWQPPLLPYLEESALSFRYDLKKDWGDASVNAGGMSNKTISNTEIKTFQCPSVIFDNPPKTSRSDYAYAVGYELECQTKTQSAVGTNYRTYSDKSGRGYGFWQYSNWPSSGIPFTKGSEVSDGLSQTWVLAEDAGRPREYRAKSGATGWQVGPNEWNNPSAPFWMGEWCNSQCFSCVNGNELYSFHPGGGIYLFGDGAVKQLPYNIKLAVFYALFTRAGGDRPGPEWE